MYVDVESLTELVKLYVFQEREGGREGIRLVGKQAIATGLEAIAIRLKAIATRLKPSLSGWREAPNLDAMASNPIAMVSKLISNRWPPTWWMHTNNDFLCF